MAKPAPTRWRWLGASILGLASACTKQTPSIRSDSDEAPRACESALRAEGDALRAPEGKSQAELQKGWLETQKTCGAVFAEPSCRAAWQSLPTDGTQAEKVRAQRDAIDACRAAYCPRITLPGAMLCNDADWHSLRASILAQDLGHERGEALEKLFAENAVLLSDIVRKASTIQSAEPFRADRLTLVVDEKGITVKGPKGNLGPSCEGTTDGITIPNVTTDAGGAFIDRKALGLCARKLKDHEFAGTNEVAILAGKGIPYQMIIDCIDTVKGDDRGELFPMVHFGIAPGSGKP